MKPCVSFSSLSSSFQSNRAIHTFNHRFVLNAQIGKLLQQPRSEIIVAQNALIKAFIRHSPRPSAPSFAAKQTFRARGLLQHAIFLHGLHLVAGGVGEEVLKVLVFEGERVACDACGGS